MKYKYKKSQIFGKRLNIPKVILKKVYNSTLDVKEYFKYELDDKIPITCVNSSDRILLDKFGVDKFKNFDWNLFKVHFDDRNINIRDLLIKLSPNVTDINTEIYEQIKDIISLYNYTPAMREKYSNRFFEISDNLNHLEESLMSDFNNGKVKLAEMIKHWNLFKDKDLSYCLSHDSANTKNITEENIRTFMDNYKDISDLISTYDDIYSVISYISQQGNIEEKNSYIKSIANKILEQSMSKNSLDKIYLSDEKINSLLRYSSIEDYLKVDGLEFDVDNVMKELKLSGLPESYLLDIPIPITVLKDSDVLRFVSTYGLKNIVDFDNDCGHFFTKNDCEMLKLMFAMYLHFSGNEYDPNKKIDTKKVIEENGNYIDRPYTKDEFYEAMRRMIIYGPSDGSYADKAPDYREITGEFRVRNADLFISEQAPEGLQKLFYTKSITPNLLVKHPEYIQYLEEKNLISCFKNIEIKVEKSSGLHDLDDFEDFDEFEEFYELYKSKSYENIYKFLSSKTDFNGIMNFITQYSDVLDIVFSTKAREHFDKYEVVFSTNDDIKQISSKINEVLRKIIVEKEIPYPKQIPEELIQNYPSMFLSKNAPKELKEAFYTRKISSKFILSNPSYIKFLENVDLEVLFKYMPVSLTKGSRDRKEINLISGINSILGSKEAFNVMLLYGEYIEQVFNDNKLQNFKFNSDFTKNDLLNEMDKTILQNIIDGNMKYDENIPSHFKNNNKTLFLSSNVSQEIKEKFYNREFTLKDFNDNPELFDIFENTNIACAFPEKMSWIIPLFNNSNNFKKANYNRMKVISAYSKIQDVELQKAFKEYVMECGANIDIEKIEFTSEVLSRLSLSNSSEIFTFRKELATQILKSTSPLECLSRIEDVFIRNNIPTVGKIYSCFEILHPDFKDFNFESSIISPVLKKSSTTSRKVIVFSDLIKASFGSNNRNINVYLKNIEIGSNLYENIKSGQIQFDLLREDEKKELKTFCNHLATLYNNTVKSKKENETFIPSDDVLNDILILSKKLSPDGKLDYNLADRVIRMFCGLAGINTLEQAKGYIKEKVKTADLRNRNTANSDMVLEKGDFIKGIGDITYLRNILQNGSVSKEYLGSSADSDSTPLDTDVSMIMNSEGSIREKMNATAAANYGPIWFVLKNDDRFVTTRTGSGGAVNSKRDRSKMEAFYTGVLGEDHYGIRTGFASSEINYIVMENYDPKVGLEIAMNGFYIPIANKEGKIVFTPKDYDELRKKMNGLSYFGEENYSFSENLVTEETEYLASQIEQNNYEVQGKREKINSIIKKSLQELGLHLKTNIDGDLTENYVELIDTGSTGRGTNKPGDGDFDFMMRLDKSILSNPSKLNELKQTILKNLGKEHSSELTETGDFRLKSVQLDNNINVDIDITFTEKTDKVLYSTDMALQDRLETIKKMKSEKYKYVVANILLAKQVLKKAEVYKPNRGEIPQGGLGGVGIENWILQNGGSFIDAAKSFVEASEGKSFSEFQSIYQIWDFGDNHLAERRGQYVHDNFVANNMSESGYQKMVYALKEYLRTMEISKFETKGISSSNSR